VGYVPGAAHFVNVESAEVFNQMLLEFLQKVLDKPYQPRIQQIRS
jgi:hypothetical protein